MRPSARLDSSFASSLGHKAHNTQQKPISACNPLSFGYQPQQHMMHYASKAL
ncbi:hypothetical protein HanRHA438_Chr01g0032561 [Helianthus annuus]|nr:hypothetical protein HanIR_Chr01g0034931 [Helianthus annuus]KAJ0948876.1 hypothetical protein HanRHA438_Chr01g0032561 [Helianthus annuus]